MSSGVPFTAGIIITLCLTGIANEFNKRDELSVQQALSERFDACVEAGTVDTPECPVRISTRIPGKFILNYTQG
ncbi:MAG: hypothetical protein CMH30_08645 [Micavibrio sp.]|nr:hypothetical protein [Micavibrio sp.]|tara:strand:+ start:1118 stop:1339 length:222 start_codon:yes stop_codon:yes gene_type:complete